MAANDDIAVNINMVMGDAEKALFKELRNSITKLASAVNLLSNGSVIGAVNTARGTGGVTPGGAFSDIWERHDGSGAGIYIPRGSAGGGETRGSTTRSNDPTNDAGRNAGRRTASGKKKEEGEEEEEPKTGWSGVLGAMRKTLGDQDKDFMNAPQFGSFTIPDMIQQAGFIGKAFGGKRGEAIAKRAGLLAPISVGAITARTAAHHFNRTAGRGGLYGRLEQANLATQDFGYASTANPFNLVTGGGGREELSSAWDRTFQSRFGFSPFLSSEEAAKIGEMEHKYGYTGNERADFRRNLIDITKETAISPDTAASMIDRAYRSGSESMNDFTKALKDIPAASRGARMSVTALTESLNETANTLAEKRGTSYGPNLRSATAAASSGIDPGVYNKIGNNDMLYWQGAQLAANDGYTRGQYAARPELQSQYSVQAQTNLLHSRIDEATWRKFNDPKTSKSDKIIAGNSIREQIALAYQADAALTGGLDGDQALTYLTRNSLGGVADRNTFSQKLAAGRATYTNEREMIKQADNGIVDLGDGRKVDVSHMSKADKNRLMDEVAKKDKSFLSDDQIRAELVAGGATPDQLRQVFGDFHRRQAHGHVYNVGHARSHDDVLKEAMKLFAKQSGQLNENSATTTNVIIGFTPKAQQSLEVVSQTTSNVDAPARSAGRVGTTGR